MSVPIVGVWFVAGLVLGWFGGWLFARSRHRPKLATQRLGEPSFIPPAPTTHDAPLAEDMAAAAPAQARVIDVGAARAAGFNLKHADDLTVIEGIGPRIDDLLHANGVVSFAQLAELSVPDTLAILERGGPHFQLANPGLWARQAALASENRWGELKQLQEELISGGGAGM